MMGNPGVMSYNLNNGKPKLYLSSQDNGKIGKESSTSEKRSFQICWKKIPKLRTKTAQFDAVDVERYEILTNTYTTTTMLSSLKIVQQPRFHDAIRTFQLPFQTQDTTLRVGCVGAGRVSIVALCLQFLHTQKYSSRKTSSSTEELLFLEQHTRTKKKPTTTIAGNKTLEKTLRG